MVKMRQKRQKTFPHFYKSVDLTQTPPPLLVTSVEKIHTSYFFLKESLKTFELLGGLGWVVMHSKWIY